MISINSEKGKELIKALKDNSVELIDIAEIVFKLQSKYYSNLTIDDCLKSVHKVVNKREVQNAGLTGLFLDKVTKDLLKKEINIDGYEELFEEIIRDEGTFGVDEQIAMEICSVYGSIAITNFGYVDKTKPLIIGELNSHVGNTFIDDIVGAIAAAGAAIIAHNHV